MVSQKELLNGLPVVDEKRFGSWTAKAVKTKDNQFRVIVFTSAGSPGVQTNAFYLLADAWKDALCQLQSQRQAS